MEFRKARISDINDINNMIDDAKLYLKKNDIDQWQNGYPNKDVIKKDIDSGQAYVIEKDSNIACYFMISFDGEHTYEKIYEGAWSSNDCYGVIHRVVIKDNLKGLGLSHLIFNSAETLCTERNIFSIRIDTHRKNIPMQNALKSHGYTYSGIIYLDDGAERLAFEKNLL